MNFSLRIDDSARANVPALGSGRSAVTVSDREFALHINKLLDLQVDRSLVEGARPMADPRPQVHLAPGVSSAVENLGTDTLAVIGAHDGLVVVDFTEVVEARKTIPANPVEPDAPTEGAVHFRHLILSLEDPDGFLEAVGQVAVRDEAPAATPLV